MESNCKDLIKAFVKADPRFGVWFDDPITMFFVPGPNHIATIVAQANESKDLKKLLINTSIWMKTYNVNSPINFTSLEELEMKLNVIGIL